MEHSARYINLSEGIVHYKEPTTYQDKPVIIFIHGASINSQNTEFWNDILPIMEEYCNPVRVDGFGHGKSKANGKGSGDLKYKSYLAVTRKVLEDHPDHPLILVGRSQGGRYVGELIKEVGEKIDAIGFIAPAISSKINWDKHMVCMWDTKDPVISVSRYKLLSNATLYTAGEHPDAKASVPADKSPTHAPELVYPELFRMFIKDLCQNS